MGGSRRRGARRRRDAACCREAELALGRRRAGPQPRQCGLCIRSAARGRGVSRGRQRLRLPTDGRQRVGMDGFRFRAVSRLQRRSIRGLLATLVPYPQGASRRVVGDERAPGAAELSQLLHARAQRCHCGIPHLRALSERRRADILRVPDLNGRAWPRAIGAEHAAVTRFWAQLCSAASAFIEKLTGVGRHHFRFRSVAVRAGDDAFTDYCFSPRS